METAAQPWPSIDVAKVKWPMRFMPSLADFAFLLPVFLCIKMQSARVFFADGDTGWHIRTGEWILQHAAVPKEDLFSFTKPHAPWFAWEWAWDVLFAILHHFWGLSGVGVATVVLIGLSSLLLYKLVARACRNEVLALLVTVLSISGSGGHWLARPHLISWLFFLTFLHVLQTAQEGKLKVLFWLPLLMVLWCNLHGAFFIGIAAILTTAAGVAMETCWSAAQSTRSFSGWFRVALASAKPYLFCALACTVATFVNPYGWHLHQHIALYLGDATIMDGTQEFQSMNFHHGQAIFFELMLLASGASIVWSLRRRSVTEALLMLCWAHLALVSARNIAFFLIVAAPPVACLLQELLVQGTMAPLFRSFACGLQEICDELKTFERVRRVHFISGAAVLLVAILFAFHIEGFEAEFDRATFPYQALPVIEASSAKRIFTFDQWGDFLIYRLYPSKSVFIDGRGDFYGDDLLTSTGDIVDGHFNWSSLLRRYGVEMVVVKPSAGLSTILKTAPGWKMLFDDGKVLVFEVNKMRPPDTLAEKDLTKSSLCAMPITAGPRAIGRRVLG